MSKLQKAVYHIHEIDETAAVHHKQDTIHPIARILVTIIYILFVVSFPKYDIWGLMGMILYLLINGILYDISIKNCMERIGAVLLLVSIVGIANPFMDRKVYMQTDFFTITFGMISMVTLMLKGIFSVIASYILILTTGMEKICYGLRCLHIPKEFVTILLLIYRYLIVLLKEVERMSQAYRLRALKQKGIHIKTWGAFVGQLLLRSIERADVVYESMLLRGYDGEFLGNESSGKPMKSIRYVLIWSIVFAVFRCIPIFQIAGGLI